MSVYFDEAYYLKAKLAELHAIGEKDSAGNAYTQTSLLKAITDAGLTPESHYQTFGRIEGLNPNAYFNESEYLQSKLQQLHSMNERDADGNAFTLETLVKAIEGLGMTPAEHYETFGRYETNADGTLINPSKPADPLAVPGDSGYVAPPANLADTNDNPVVLVPSTSGSPTYGVVADDGKTVNGVDAGGKPTTEVIGTVTPTPEPGPDPTPPTPTDPNVLTTGEDHLTGTSGDDTFTGTWVDGTSGKGTLQTTDTIKSEGTDTLTIDMSKATTWDLSTITVGSGKNINVAKVVLTGAKTGTETNGANLKLDSMAASIELQSSALKGRAGDDFALSTKMANSVTLTNTTVAGGQRSTNAKDGAGWQTGNTKSITLNGTSSIAGGEGVKEGDSTSQWGGGAGLFVDPTTAGASLTITGKGTSPNTITGGKSEGSSGGIGISTAIDTNGTMTKLSSLILSNVAVAGGNALKQAGAGLTTNAATLNIDGGENATITGGQSNAPTKEGGLPSAGAAFTAKLQGGRGYR